MKDMINQGKNQVLIYLDHSQMFLRSIHTSLRFGMLRGLRVAYLFLKETKLLLDYTSLRLQIMSEDLVFLLRLSWTILISVTRKANK